MANGPSERHELDEAIAALERQRGLLPDSTVDIAIGALRAQLGAVANEQNALAVGVGGVAVDGNSSGDINTGWQFSAAQVNYAEEGATVVIGDAPVAMTAFDRKSALGRYLQRLISQNRYLQLQGIRSGGKLVNIELDRIYVTLCTTRQRAERAEADWLAGEMGLAPGERHRAGGETPSTDTTLVTVNEALADNKRLVVLGDPSSGKTTLLRYLALVYARDLAEHTRQVQEELDLAENALLPIFLELRQIGRYLAQHRPNDDGTEGHLIVLQFLSQMLKNERIEVPVTFFDEWLESGNTVVLLDGLDEVADFHLRRRVARLVDAFIRAYPDCRYVVTSRIVGYTDTSELNEDYATARVCDFTMDDVRLFLSQWHRLVAIGQMGPGEKAEAFAANETRRLLDAIGKNDRVRELAINPLMLTVIALTHRDRAMLPNRRAELYQEAVDVLLGKWDEARSVQEPLILNDRPFGISGRRLVLQHLALTMHEKEIKEIDAEPLRELLAQQLGDAVQNSRELDAAVKRFLMIQERTGLLIARAEGTYAFSHLTFQDYLAALQIAGRDDYVDYTLSRIADECWREVILLEAGYLSTQSKEKTIRLIKAIADVKKEPAPYYNLVLAAECVREAGSSRIVGNLESELRVRLQRELEMPHAEGLFAAVHTLFTRGMTAKATTKQRIAAAEALGTIDSSRFWTMPHGEPEWVRIPVGEFTMGESSAAHRVNLPEFAISRVPITDAQYQLFLQATGHEPFLHWSGKRVPGGREIHPVVVVTWGDALAYCRWLSEITAKLVTLPSEAEWEKAARGVDDARDYPWGDAFDAARCNVAESGFGGTTPVGIFLDGASPYRCLDMAGNVWEWTRSLWGFDYPYDPADRNREDINAGNDERRVVRGGSWLNARVNGRCAFRFGLRPDLRYDDIGFRVVLRCAPVP